MRHEIEPTATTLQRVLDRYAWDDYGVLSGLLAWVARGSPHRLPGLLAAIGWPRSGSSLERVAGPALSILRPGDRAPVLSALCFDHDPAEYAPRPSLDVTEERWNAFSALARHPPARDELDQVSATVDRRWRSNLAHLAAFADDGGAWLAEMEAHERSHTARLAARHARLRREQRTHVSEMLRRLAADPVGVLRSPLALHLALRLDGTHQHELDALMRTSFDARRALSWILRSARNRPTDWIPTP